MCCYTHSVIIEGQALAESEQERCRCTSGGEDLKCHRRITEEDLRCDVCRHPPALDPPPVDGTERMNRWLADREPSISRALWQDPEPPEPNEWLGPEARKPDPEAVERYLKQRYAEVTKWSWSERSAWDLPSDKPYIERSPDGLFRRAVLPPSQNSPPPEP